MRLTSVRCNGIKSGWWSPAKKDELVQRLGAYEETGMEPEEIMAMKEKMADFQTLLQAQGCSGEGLVELEDLGDWLPSW